MLATYCLIELVIVSIQLNFIKRIAFMEKSENDSKIIKQMYQYRKISSFRSIFEILIGWLQVLLLLAFFIWMPNTWTFLLIFVLVGARQYGLLILLHDAQHTLLSTQRKFNDRLAIWMLAAPFGVTFSKSRTTHMRHHQHLGTGEMDPDFPLYCTGKPIPKDSLFKLGLHFGRQILWAKLMRVILPEQRNQKLSSNPSYSNCSRQEEMLAVFICQVVIFCGFALAGFWQAYFYLWILPLMTIATFLNDARIFCEHSNPQNEEDKKKGLLISYFSNPLERFFFSPHHMNYHAEHHFFPFIPHYYLPKVREVLLTQPEYQNQIQWRQGYWAHIKNYIRSTYLAEVIQSRSSYAE